MRYQRERIRNILESNYEKRVPMPKLVRSGNEFIANHTARISEIRRELKNLKMEIVCTSSRKGGVRRTFYMLKLKTSKADMALPK